MSSALYPSCDAAAARLDQAGLQAAYPRMVLIATILASSLAFVSTARSLMSACRRSVEACKGTRRICSG
jgi:hypothetical protein